MEISEREIHIKIIDDQEKNICHLNEVIIYKNEIIEGLKERIDFLNKIINCTDPETGKINTDLF